ncbi:rhamnan synthesis F family protein [Aliiroseovarius sp. xm-m-339-2]|uniref:rhamnan synthesis F family protein n=1 Tax=Aliiroseovarius sp. xm-m-339-2 TaxID=2651829 RepID=UPI00156A5BB2|nr:rhamnan synthesis F family protein [Aliiroseovarius sp. xm-m-339-2]
MLKLFSFLQTVLWFPLVRLIVAYYSERQRFRTYNQEPVVHFQKDYAGEKILLLALYQKGRLRPDVVRMLKVAKAQGLYVLASNTLKLSDPKQFDTLIDCYIERPNFGRDFGSYQTAFLHLYARDWHTQAPRLMLLNDSVFFTQERLGSFFSDMMDSDIEVLGSTENFDIEYHLGSFCIAMDRSILAHKNMQAYWKRYRLSDLRPKVIKRGEMQLSKMLKACVSSPDQFVALYSGVRYADELSSDPELLDFSIKNVRTSTINPWKRASLKNVVSSAFTRHFVRIKDVMDGKDTMKLYSTRSHKDIADDALHYVGSVESLRTFLRSLSKEDTAGHIPDEDLNMMILKEYSDAFFIGSHIHQNPIVLLKQGLPIVKNDGVYRGLVSIEDLYKMSALLEVEEAQEMRKLLLDRPYGANHLTGWKKAAFNLGYL